MDSVENRFLQSINIDDKAALELVYRQYWSKLYLYAFNVLRERDICEDIVQEIFIDLWTKKREVEISNLKAYLFQSVKYKIFNQLRRKKYKRQLLSQLNAINRQYKIDDLYEKKELSTIIKKVISELPEQRKIIFQLSRIDGLSNKEISEILNISVQTVKNQISKSLNFIRESLNSI
jgi:RNA polymerase sigma-70 factor (family 1)